MPFRFELRARTRAVRMLWGMTGEPAHLLVPGFGSRARSYAGGLPPGFVALQPPALRRSSGSLPRLVDWLVAEVERRPPPLILAGHSMGGTLAILAAVRVPARVRRLVLIAPAVLPLSKPLPTIARDTVSNLVHGVPRPPEVIASAADVLAAPRAAARLAGTLRRLDLRDEMRALRDLGLAVEVIACSTDTLVPPVLCRAAAAELGALYREVEGRRGHVWPIAEPALLASALGGLWRES